VGFDEFVGTPILSQGYRYVAVTGDNTGPNSCTDPSNPCQTILQALNFASNGEQVLLAGGHFTENLTITAKDLTVRGGYLISGTEWITRGGETTIHGGGIDTVFEIYNSNSTLEDLTIADGASPDDRCSAGGIWVTDANVTIRRSIFRHNVTACSGGAIEVHDDNGPASLVVEDSLFLDNYAGHQAGAVSVWQTSGVFTNVVFANNEAPRGGALSIRNSPVTIQNSTIVNNTGDEAINVFDIDGQPDTLVVRNSILWGNGRDISCNITNCDISYSINSDGWGGIGNFSQDPLLADPDNDDFHLLSSSPAIDAGTLIGAPDHDIEGDLRPQNLGIDIGADEYAFCIDVQGIPTTECQALVDFYLSTDGDHWDTNTDWIGTDTPCSWYGVSCDGGHVHDIRLENNQLNGAIPASIGELKNLIQLVLSENQLSGGIPAELGFIAGLSELNLSDNPLGGPIPPELGNLVNMEKLFLTRAELTGTIPAELGNLVNMTWLTPFGNHLTGPIPPELGDLTSLEYLYMWNNELTGTIPAELGNLTNLIELGLDGNQLTGPIPSELISLTQLAHLALENNQLTGPIPSALGELSNLQGMNLSRNLLTGTIPTTFENLINLENLDLSANNLTGGIPTQLGSMSSLQFLNLSNNDLEGYIPASFGSLTNLKELTLNLNGMGGIIPPEMGDMTSLEKLVLGPNQITGTIPTELGNLPNLRDLVLFENHLQGAIPPNLGNLPSLERLALNSNHLTGTIPASLGNLTTLKTLYLDDNMLSGNIPISITNLVNLVNDGWYWYWDFHGAADLGYNLLTSDSPGVDAFLNDKDPDWADTQTLPPTHLQVDKVEGNEIDLSWRPITYTQDGGYYEIFVAVNPEGPFVLHGRTGSKSIDTYTASNLFPDSTHYFMVRTHTPAHDLQWNDLWSDFSDEISATTEAVGVQITVDTVTGDTIVYTDTQQLTTTVEIPAGSVSATTTIVFTEVQTPTLSEPAGFVFAGQTFDINAYYDGLINEGFTFSIPITITLHYSESELAGAEDELLLMYWNEDTATWLDAACGAYNRNLAEDWLSVPICHLSNFALVVEEPIKIFLPLVLR